MEIKLQKRYKYVGEILEALIEKAGFDLDVAGEFLNGIKDAEVIEQMHGEWISDGYGYSWCYKCSVCGWVDGYPFNDRHKFCPNCGAKMDGGGK